MSGDFDEETGKDNKLRFIFDELLSIKLIFMV